MSLIHGFQPTDVRCPYCGDMHGMRQTETRRKVEVVVYRCWCGASRVMQDERPDDIEAS
jgi:predicted RNA-binding Zn-ribbon protein involved in translation (DUF1610 family)